MRRTAAAITSRIWFQGPRVSREPAKVDSRRLATSAFDGFSGSLLPARKSQSGSGTRKGDPLKDARLSSGDAVDSIQVPNLPRFLTRTQLVPRNAISQRSALFDVGKSPCRLLIGWSVGGRSPQG